MIGSLTHLGFYVYVESGAGEASGFTDAEFSDSGASVVTNLPSGLDILLRVSPPTDEAIRLVRPGGAVVGFLDPSGNSGLYATHTDAHFVAIDAEHGRQTTHRRHQRKQL